MKITYNFFSSILRRSLGGTKLKQWHKISTVKYAPEEQHEILWTKLTENIRSFDYKLRNNKLIKIDWFSQTVHLDNSVGFNRVKLQEGGGGLNSPFKIFAQNQILSQYTENKSIYLSMNRFILTLFMFKNVYLSQVILEVMQINLQATHTLILKRKQWTAKTVIFNFYASNKGSNISLSINWVTYHNQTVLFVITSS